MPNRPKMNEIVEAANKNIKKILQKMTENYQIGTRSSDLPYLPTEFQHVLLLRLRHFHWFMVWKSFF